MQMMLFLTVIEVLERQDRLEEGGNGRDLVKPRGIRRCGFA
jgi:hypothetical protein